MTYMKVESDLKLHSEHISESKDIAHQRDHFSSLSTSMYQLIEAAKPSTTITTTIAPCTTMAKVLIG